MTPQFSSNDTMRDALIPIRPLSLLLSALLWSQAVQALPEDREQEIHVDASSTEVLLNEGRIIYQGTESKPATITQGSMKIAGLEIVVEYEDSELRRISASGNPARFQQQPAIDRAVIHGSAGHTVYDTRQQLLVLEDNAELSQDNNRMRGYFIEYNMNEGRARALSRDDDDRINMILQPENP